LRLIFWREPPNERAIHPKIGQPLIGATFNRVTPGKERSVMVFFRWIFGLPLAALVTAGLFAVMAGLIQKPTVTLLPKKDAPEIDIHMKPLPPDGPETKLKNEKVPKTPPIEIEFPGRREVPGPVVPKPGKTPIDPKGPEGGNQFSGPVIRVAPPYPEACRSRGIEGDVIVQFDVTPEGTVVNVQIIDAPDRCFNRIVSTVSKWKYPPSYRNGRPVMRYGVVERFNFQLVD
jgi:periplasmic protein TonB